MRSAALLILAVCVACSEDDEPTAHSTSLRAPDTVDPEGLLEGSVVAFDLRFPQRSTVEQSTPDARIIEVPYAMAKVADFVRQRVDAETERLADGQVRFESAKVIGSEAADRFDIILAERGNSTKVTLLRSFSARPTFLPGRPASETPDRPAPSGEPLALP